MTASAQKTVTGGKAIVFGMTVLVFAMMAVVAQLPMPMQDSLLAEGGPFETLSVVGYGLCILLMFVLWPAASAARRWYFAVFMALFAARELDLDKKPFTEGLLKARQFSSDGVSLMEKGVAGVILVAIIATGLILLRRETWGFIRGVAKGAAPQLAVLIGLLFIIVYKLTDGLARKLEPFGITLGQDQIDLAYVIEEVGELGIPLMFAVAIYLTYRLPRLAAAAPSTAP
jgi:hypothetical protein